MIKDKKELARTPSKVVKPNNNNNNTTNKMNGQFQQMSQSLPLQQQQHNYSELSNNSTSRFSQNREGDEMRRRAQTLQSLSSGSERLD